MKNIEFLTAVAGVDITKVQISENKKQIFESKETDELFVFVRQLEDLHNHCSGEVTEIINHFKTGKDFGSRSAEDVKRVYEIYKQLYVELFKNH